jgi:hypothetical protein
LVGANLHSLNVETGNPIRGHDRYGVEGIRGDLRHVPVAVKRFSAIELHQKLAAAMDSPDP